MPSWGYDNYTYLQLISIYLHNVKELASRGQMQQIIKCPKLSQILIGKKIQSEAHNFMTKLSLLCVQLRQMFWTKISKKKYGAYTYIYGVIKNLFHYDRVYWLFWKSEVEAKQPDWKARCGFVVSVIFEQYYRRGIHGNIADRHPRMKETSPALNLQRALPVVAEKRVLRCV